jgi:glycerate 2-kinase
MGLTGMALLRRAFEHAVNAAQPAACLPNVLARIEDRGPALVLGAGKAAATMAAAFCANWEYPVRGLVVTRYEHGLRDGERACGIEIIEAGHPSPDSASVTAGKRLLEFAGSLRANEQLFWLVSGGGSALATVPLPPLSFEQKREAADFLIGAGADIREINCVRKHLSALKGGRLAQAAHPGRVTTFAISDVPGDNIADIASGPTIPDPSTQPQALAVLTKYGYPLSPELEHVLTDPSLETPKAEDTGFAADRSFLLANAATALTAARSMLEEQGYEVICLGDDLADEARELGREHAQIALRYCGSRKRIAILSGGETRVVIKRTGGRGGRNLEYLAGLALEIRDREELTALAADTDGIDGHGGHAGGFLLPGMMTTAESIGVSLEERLAANDSYAFFDACGGLLVTGPTRTNVNDFRLIVCES